MPHAVRPVERPSAIGIDDWAFRRGQRSACWSATRNGDVSSSCYRIGRVARSRHSSLFTPRSPSSPMTAAAVMGKRPRGLYSMPLKSPIAGI